MVLRIARILIVICLWLGSRPLSAQEIKATVQVVANPQLTQSNKQVLTTLQTAMQQFINTRKWTEETPTLTEKIEISMFMEVMNINNNDFSTKLQVQVIRPVLALPISLPH